jgi:Family of unknown function (DUF6516)
MSSHWVQDDLDLVKWVDRTVTNAGAYWASSKPGWMIGPVTVTGTTGDAIGVVLKTNNYAVFSDDTRLKVEFSAYNSQSSGWVYPAYSYGYERSDGSIIFRYDKHRDRERGVDCHVHFGSDHDHDRLPTREVDLEDVLARVAEFQSGVPISYVC